MNESDEKNFFFLFLSHLNIAYLAGNIKILKESSHEKMVEEFFEQISKYILLKRSKKIKK